MVSWVDDFYCLLARALISLNLVTQGGSMKTIENSELDLVCGGLDGPACTTSAMNRLGIAAAGLLSLAYE